ncbi:MAG TPA: diaminopimelate decarboxylase [Candidatus Onthovicinus excrementipullorum]|nr:diaminopimelate decarboxylase [Candidatus Onthovicinus excrementipullorum]
MFVSECLDVNRDGHLTIGGCDTVELVRRYGTPLYVMDETQIREHCRAFVQSIKENYDGHGRVLFASKAFCCKEMCRIVESEDMGLDVVSGGELYTALSAGFPADRIYFHGNNKTDLEIETALEAGIARIIVDNFPELETINRIAGTMGKKADIMFRIKPGIDAHTHSFIRTGQIDSKFGVALETGEAMQIVKRALELENVNLCGLHCHIGSQILDVDPFEHAAEVMLKFIADIKTETGFTVRELNLGGGFGIKYLESDNPVAYSEYMNRVARVVKARAQEYGVDLPYILIEPGRSIVGSAGITLYTVGAVKTIPDIRTYVSVDGGMCDNPRYILYSSDYDVLCANKANEPRDFKVTVAGKCCESGDLIQENTPIQRVEHGDILAVLSTGAYNYSMSSNYNRIPRPPVVMVCRGESRVIVKGETFEDLVRNDV